jgi:hypothetical protein
VTRDGKRSVDASTALELPMPTDRPELLRDFIAILRALWQQDLSDRGPSASSLERRRHGLVLPAGATIMRVAF